MRAIAVRLILLAMEVGLLSHWFDQAFPDLQQLRLSQAVIVVSAFGMWAAAGAAVICFLVPLRAEGRRDD